MLEQIGRFYYQQWFVDPVVKNIQHYFTSMQITIGGGILGICVAPALVFQQVGLAIMLLLLSGYLDTLDGAVARNKNQMSALGAVMDILTDRSVEFAVIFGLWLVQPQERSLLCLLMLGSVLLCVTSFLAVAIFTPNNSSRSRFKNRGFAFRQGRAALSSAVYTTVNEQRKSCSDAASVQKNIFETASKGFHYSPGIMERAEAFIFFIFMMILPQYFIIFAIFFSLLVFLTAILHIYQFTIYQKSLVH